jgi:hypothetical protein
MSGRDDDDPDGLCAELAGAVERVNRIEDHYRQGAGS